jgi:hypothetical protein
MLSAVRNTRKSFAGRRSNARAARLRRLGQQYCPMPPALASVFRRAGLDDKKIRDSPANYEADFANRGPWRRASAMPHSSVLSATDAARREL